MKKEMKKERKKERKNILVLVLEYTPRRARNTQHTSYRTLHTHTHTPITHRT